MISYNLFSHLKALEAIAREIYEPFSFMTPLDLEAGDQKSNLTFARLAGHDLFGMLNKQINKYP